MFGDESSEFFLATNVTTTGESIPILRSLVLHFLQSTNEVQTNDAKD